MLRTRDYYNPSDDRLRLVNRLHLARPYLAILMLLTALSGFTFNIAMNSNYWTGETFRSFTHPATALCLSLLAIAVYLTPRIGEPDKIVPAVRVCSGSLALIHFTVASSGVDPLGEFLPIVGRMSLDTCVAIMLMSLAIRVRPRSPAPGLICLSAFLGIMMNCIIGLTFGVTYFGGQMAPLTLVSLCFGAVCALSLHADHGVVRVILLASEVGTRTRVMAAVGTLVPWAAGMFLYRYWGMPTDSFQIEAVMISIIIMTTVILAVMSGYQHQMADEMRSRAERRLAEQAVTDGLTGLANRAGLTQVMRRRMGELRRTNKPSGLVMFDLDHFKKINDTHGHDEGDRVLVSIGRALEPLLRKGDVLGRWGGEEFILVADIRHPDDLAKLVERLRVVIHALSSQTGVHCKTGAYLISASFGVSYMLPDDESYNDAVKRADLALYDAKAKGRNRVIFAKGDIRAA